nr:hypothetical protein CFP56_48189 [Quercus suber]
MAEDSVDTITSQAAKLNRLKCKISLKVVPTSNEGSKILLIGKILSSKAFSKSLVKEILIKAWNVINDIEVFAVDKNLFMFSFKHEADVKRAWDRRPWTVKGEHLVLKRFSPDISVSEVDFSFTKFWIQIHGLPLNWTRVWSRNVVKVEIDASYPLFQGFPLERDQLPDLWIPFKSEKLGNFCYGCGMLGHDQRDCPDKGVQLLLKEGGNFGFYGKWLRADNVEFQPGINLENLLNPN